VTSYDLHHCDKANGRSNPVSGQAQSTECQRLKKIRIVDFLEGKTASVLAILVFIIIAVVLAFIMSQTG
jgi:hypothetical protein